MRRPTRFQLLGLLRDADVVLKELDACDDPNCQEPNCLKVRQRIAAALEAEYSR